MKKFLSLRSSQKGFTLIELLVVIGILAVLLAIVLVAINPAKQFSQSNDTQRQSDVNAILNAVHQYAADYKGTLPGGGTIDNTVKVIGSGAGQANLCADLVTEYLAALPGDPTDGAPAQEADCTTGYNTAYSITRSATNNRITVSATGEITDPIQVTR